MESISQYLHMIEKATFYFFINFLKVFYLLYSKQMQYSYSDKCRLYSIHSTNCHIRCAVCVFHHIFSFFLQYIYSIETESTHNSFRFPDIKKRARGTEREKNRQRERCLKTMTMIEWSLIQEGQWPLI